MLCQLYVTFDPSETNESHTENAAEKLGCTLGHEEYKIVITRS